jgi:quercetin dioxygenase-like cupin family protein
MKVASEGDAKPSAVGAPAGAAGRPAAVGPAPSGEPVAPPRSRVVRFDPERHAWDGVPTREYKSADGSWAAVTRQVLVGANGEGCGFHLRYFEVAPGGHTTLERHCHEHAVVVLRGSGEVELGGERHALGFGDVVWVGPAQPHRFRNRGAEPFGFLCAVDAVRDRPEPLADGGG